MTPDDFYDLPEEAYLKLDISLLSPQDLSELAYYIWSFHEDNQILLNWRLNTLLPLLESYKLEISAEVEDLNGE